VVYLPPLSPRYNPVEYVFSFIKQKIRKDAPRTKEKLEASIHGAFAAITPENLTSWIEYAGFGYKPAETEKRPFKAEILIDENGTVVKTKTDGRQKEYKDQVKRPELYHNLTNIFPEVKAIERPKPAVPTPRNEKDEEIPKRYPGYGEKGEDKPLTRPESFFEREENPEEGIW